MGVLVFARTWRTVYRVESSASADTILGILREHAQADNALTVVPATDPMSLAWTYAAEDGSHWRLDLAATDTGDAGHFRVRAELVRVGEE